jgi:hypothetical protein
MFEDEIEGFEGQEYSELFGKKAKARRAARRAKRRSGLSDKQKGRRAKFKSRFGNNKLFARFRNRRRRRRSGFSGEFDIGF